MATNLLDRYKKNRTNETARLQMELNKTANPKEAYKDSRFWNPTVDKAGNGSAIIRFLPARDDDQDAYVTRYFHSFKGPTGQYYIENCRTMLGKETPDPVLEFNDPLWNGSEADKKQASQQKRKVKFISNILVIKDPKNPSNEGKVFLFEYGKKTLERLNKLMNPSDEQVAMGKKPINPFDLMEGVNYNLIQTKKDNFPNYDDSEFSAPCPASTDDAVLEKVLGSMYDLRPLVAPEVVKSYDELQKRLFRVLGVGTGAPAPKASTPSAKPSTSKPVAKQPVDDDDEGEQNVDDLIDELTK